jgi:hypothetical protein
MDYDNSQDDDDDDDDDDDEFWKEQTKNKKTFKVNPKGPYTLKITVKGILWNVVIKSISHNDFKVKALSNKKASKNDLEVLKVYLDKEGFIDAAKKHNLYW